jgi:NAD(P) transhydrogenase subunit alpha
MIPFLLGVPNAEHATAPGSPLVPIVYVLLLATFIGLGVITRVSRLLHTPLMSLTNAISAIAVVGSLAVAGQDHPPLITLMGAIALAASMANIVSGFLITDRMLKMFHKRGKQP